MSVSSSLYHQVAFARWGKTVRPILVLNPHTDVPMDIREEWASFPKAQDFQICCLIGGDLLYIPRRNIIEYHEGVAEGYDVPPLTKANRLPLEDTCDRETQISMELLAYLLHESPEKRVHAVTRSLVLEGRAY